LHLLFWNAEHSHQISHRFLFNTVQAQDVVAPGKSVYSARADPAFTGECDDTASSGIISKSGTSMAAPVTAGSAAMVRQYFEEGWHITGQRDTSQGFKPRASLVKAVLLNGKCRLQLLTLFSDYRYLIAKQAKLFSFSCFAS
jgi:Subtilase family